MPRVSVEILGDASQLRREYRRAMGDTKSFGDTLGHLGKIAGIVAGAAGLAGVAATLKVGYSEWKQSTQVAAQTAAVLESTGAIANVTAGQVDALAGSLMRKSGVDDETVKTGENMLLTFTNIRNEVGKGNDIFNQTTGIVLDMATAMTHGNVTQEAMSKTAIQVGKALQDPIAGVGALRRVGVNLDDQQKNLIRTLVESGDTLGAQKVILQELTKEFGGSAEAAGKTLPGQLNILKESFSNVAGEAMTKLVPALTASVGWVVEHWPEISATVNAVFAGVKFAVEKVIVPVFGTLIDMGRKVVGFIQENWPEISATVRKTIDTIRAVVDPFIAAFTALWERFGDDIVKIVRTTFATVGAVIGDVVQVVKGVFNLIGDLIHGRWGEVWADLKQIVSGVLDGVAALLRGAVTVWWTLAKALGTALKDAIVEGATGVGAWVLGMLNGLADTITGKAGALAAAAGNAGKAIKDSIVDAVLGIGREVWERVTGILEFLNAKKDEILGWGAKVGNWIKDGILDAVQSIPDAVWNKIKGLGGLVEGGLGKINPFGDVRNPNLAAPAFAARADLNPKLWGTLGLAESLGLAATSIYRPGAITKHGTPSDHGVYPSKAFDVAGSAASMAEFFRDLIGNTQIKQAFYDPMGSVFGGAWNPYREGGHSDHVHVATYDTGGWLKPGLTLAWNRTGQAEQVIAPRHANVGETHYHFAFPNYLGDRQQLVDAITSELGRAGRRNGGSALGGLA